MLEKRSSLGSVILCGTFRRISQLWDNAHTLNLENCLPYLSSTISQFFDFIRGIVFDFIFLLRDSAHTLLDNRYFDNFVTNVSCIINKKKHGQKLAGINLLRNRGQPMQHVAFLLLPLFVLGFIFFFFFA